MFKIFILKTQINRQSTAMFVEDAVWKFPSSPPQKKKILVGRKNQ